MLRFHVVKDEQIALSMFQIPKPEMKITSIGQIAARYHAGDLEIGPTHHRPMLRAFSLPLQQRDLRLSLKWWREFWGQRWRSWQLYHQVSAFRFLYPMNSRVYPTEKNRVHGQLVSNTMPRTESSHHTRDHDPSHSSCSKWFVVCENSVYDSRYCDEHREVITCLYQSRTCTVVETAQDSWTRI